ncbi:MAG TPA: carboxymethylenebutenolidase [Janthinobacterium sp.]|nr:carboxymethylenebutenolidase [Janthinobacterium sp.]
MSVTTKWIEIASADGGFGAYLAVPHVGKGPGIVLIQEIFGVNEHIRAVAEQYAADGYTVLVPDLFWRSAPRIELGYADADWKTAVGLMHALDADKALSDIALTTATLRALPGADGKIAALGYCMGGLFAYRALAAGLVDTAVAYYGGGIQNQLALAERIKGPLLMHFGAEDAHISAAAVQAIAERFEDNAEVEIHVYPGAGHGFNCNHRSSYHQRAAAEAHGNSLTFLADSM